MSKMNNGGPAFPSMRDIRYHSEAEFETEEGMSLRDYFAAHAPEAPLWFQPVMPDMPIIPPVLQIKYTEEPQCTWIKAYFDENEEWFDNDEEAWEHGPVPDDFKREVEAYAQSRYDAVDELGKWKEDKHLQAMVQWRYYYADAMLKAREEPQP